MNRGASRSARRWVIGLSLHFGALWLAQVGFVVARWRPGWRSGGSQMQVLHPRRPFARQRKQPCCRPARQHLDHALLVKRDGRVSITATNLPGIPPASSKAGNSECMPNPQTVWVNNGGVGGRPSDRHRSASAGLRQRAACGQLPRTQTHRRICPGR